MSNPQKNPPSQVLDLCFSSHLCPCLSTVPLLLSLSHHCSYHLTIPITPLPPAHALGAPNPHLPSWLKLPFHLSLWDNSIPCIRELLRAGPKGPGACVVQQGGQRWQAWHWEGLFEPQVHAGTKAGLGQVLGR